MENPASDVRIVGRYALYGAIASGGMATVHLGRLLGPVGFSRTVAIKRLHPQFAADPEFVSMFLDEARLAARIRHPHVVPTLDVVATSGELFLVMDYVPGESLSRLVREARTRGTRIPIPIVIGIMSGVLQGLHAAHEARNELGLPLGIVHRDVSPQNVLVGSDGQARVLDFGVAKAVGRSQTTRDGQLKGKLSYMAPEQLRAENVTRQTDVYAASVVLWEALCGERLFAAENEGAIVTYVLDGKVVAPSTKLLDPNEASLDVRKRFERLDAVVLRGISREVSKRFETAREMALALEKCFTPATAAETSEWVESVAHPVLVQRATQVAEIESNTSTISGHYADRVQTSVSAPPQEIAVDDSFGQPATQVSSVSVSRNTAGVSSVTSPRRRRAIRTAGSVGLVVGLLAIAWLEVGRRSALRASDIPPAPSQTPPTPSGLPVAPAELAPPASSSAPTPSSSNVVPLPTTTAKKHAAQGPARTVPNGDCSPPYTWDEQGSKHYKPNCL